MPPTTLLIADDHPIFLNGLVVLLQASGHSVIAQCSSGTEVLEALQRVEPDVLLLDVNMPAPTGLEIASQLRESTHPAKIVLLTTALDDSQIEQAVRIGINGIVLKEDAPQQLIICLTKVQAGQRWFDSGIAVRAMKAFEARATADRAADQLSARELDVVKLVARGLQNKEVARELAITEGTVKMHLHTIYRKLNVRSRLELANTARDQGLL